MFTAAVFGSAGILDQINVRVQHWGRCARVVTVTRPFRPFEEIFSEINKSPERRQIGVREKGYGSDYLMSGRLLGTNKADDYDIVPAGEQSFTIYFNSPLMTYNLSRSIKFLNRLEEKAADPFLVAMAEGAQIAKFGVEQSLFRFGRPYRPYLSAYFAVRTELVDTNAKPYPGMTPKAVCGLRTDAEGVSAYGFAGDLPLALAGVKS